LAAHDLFGKLVSSFPDHALAAREHRFFKKLLFFFKTRARVKSKFAVMGDANQDVIVEPCESTGAIRSPGSRDRKPLQRPRDQNSRPAGRA
jgi:hypothetical protein